MLKKSKVWLIVLALLVVALGSVPVAAQNYSFAVPELLMRVVVQEDASVRIIYDITFENYGSPIDIVDIGTPTDDYNLSTMQASLNGAPLDDIRTSEYIDTGVEIHLEEHAIPSGQRGTLHMEFTMPDMVFSDTTNEELASLQITPTWFDSDLVRGTGTIVIEVVLPEGVAPEEALYQDEPFSDKFTDDRGYTVVVWRYEDVAATKAYRVGVSFPRAVMERVVEITLGDMVAGWLGGISAILFTCLPIGFIAFVLFLIVRAIAKASKPNYLPPIAEVEGGGIKRGLTAPEAAVILELPLNQVLTLVIFGLLEKGLVRETEADPLTLKVVEEFRVADRPGLESEEAQRQHRAAAARQRGTVIHTYEHAFLDVIEEHPDTPVKELPVVEPLEGLANVAAAKMQGFDLSDTQDYYRRVIDRAVEQASSLGEIEAREQYLDKYYPWVMMGRGYRPVMRMGGYHYWPRWARTTSAGSAAAGSRGARAGGKGSNISPTFRDVAGSFAGWTETTMGGLAAAIMPTRLQKPTPVSSSGGGGGGCACACAGCACACACAGGGR